MTKDEVKWTTNCKHKCLHVWGNWNKMSSTWGSEDVASQCSACGCWRYLIYKPEQEEPVRKNKQIWKLAEYIWNNFYHPDYMYESWETEDQRNKDIYYDKAKKLAYMFMYNAFEGYDNDQS